MPSRNWTIEQLIAFHKRKKDEDRGPDAAPKLEQAAGDAPHGAGEIPPFVRSQYFVGYTSVRSRLLDHEDCATKYFTDSLARARLQEDPSYRIIPGDAAYQVEVLVRQRKCRQGEEDHIVIDVWPANEPPPDDWIETFDRWKTTSQ